MPRENVIGAQLAALFERVEGADAPTARETIGCSIAHAYQWIQWERGRGRTFTLLGRGSTGALVLRLEPKALLPGQACKLAVHGGVDVETRLAGGGATIDASTEHWLPRQPRRRRRHQGAISHVWATRGVWSGWSSLTMALVALGSSWCSRRRAGSASE
jgi:hypothetical protein